MNIKSKCMILLVAVTLCFVLPLHAGNLKKIAQTGMKWLSIPVGARATSLGGAYTAMADDISAIFWNPAGLAFTENGHAFLTQTQWIADINVNAGAVTYQVPRLGVLGLSLASADWGTLHGTQRAANDQGYIETGEFSPTDWSAGLSFARRVSSAFSFGFNLKYLHENLGFSKTGEFDAFNYAYADMNLMAFDFGTMYYTGYRDLRFAMSIQNFSKESKYRMEQFPLPLTFKFGMAMDVAQVFGEESNHHLSLAVDAVHPRDFSERLQMGLEYNFKNVIFLRGGYKTNYDEEDFAFGAGFHYGLEGLALALDYSYVQFKNFDAVQMFSFDFNF